MDLIDSLGLGWSVAFAAPVLAAALAGCVIGTLVGVLPGLGVAAGVALLLPLVHPLPALPALAMLAAAYLGAQYGGSTPAILAQRPGEASAGAAALDGHHLARQGRAGAALATAALASCFAGIVGVLAVALVAPPLTGLAFGFGPAEYFSLVVLGLVGAVALSPGPLVKSLAMILSGLLLAQFDALVPQAPRPEVTVLREGLGAATMAIGLFAVGDVVARLGDAAAAQPDDVLQPSGRLWPTQADFARTAPSVLRGTALGALLGVVPGGGALLSSVAAYTLERIVVRRPAQPFGQGAIEGVAGPEAANNAGAQSSFIPMLALGIPVNAVTALLVAALAMHGVAAGPAVMGSHPSLFWGLVASMWIANAMLVVLNLPLVGMWARLARLPYRAVFPAVVVLSAVALTAGASPPAGVFVGAAFGVLGHACHKLQCQPVPLLLAFVMAPALELHLRTALSLADGRWSVFVARPLSAGLLIAAAILVALGTLPALRRRHRKMEGAGGR
jgi:TctA family transporter